MSTDPSLALALQQQADLEQAHAQEALDMIARFALTRSLLLLETRLQRALARVPDHHQALRIQLRHLAKVTTSTSEALWASILDDR